MRFFLDEFVVDLNGLLKSTPIIEQVSVTELQLIALSLGYHVLIPEQASVCVIRISVSDEEVAQRKGVKHIASDGSLLLHICVPAIHEPLVPADGQLSVSQSLDLKIHLVSILNDLLIDLNRLEVIFVGEVLICHLLGRIEPLLSNRFPNFGERGDVLDVVSWMRLHLGGHQTAIATHSPKLQNINNKGNTLSELNNDEPPSSCIIRLHSAPTITKLCLVHTPL